jgi:hypothetical protein
VSVVLPRTFDDLVSIGTHTPLTIEPCSGEVDTSLTAMFRLL